MRKAKVWRKRAFPVQSYCLREKPAKPFALVMLYNSLVVDYFNQLHHSAVFMSQDMAVIHKLAGEISKTCPHLEISGNDLTCCGIFLCNRYRTCVPPYPWCRQ